MNRAKVSLILCSLWLALLWPAGNLLAYRDLETGTFLTRDPAGMVDGPNLYAYVRQNPWTHFDPEGLQEDEVETPAEEAEMMRPMREAGERMEEQARAERERLSPTIPEMRAGGAEGEEQARKEAQNYNKNQELRRQKADADLVRQYMRPWEASDEVKPEDSKVSGEGKTARQQSEENQKKVPNPDGSKGKADHQKANDDLVDEMRAKHPDADEIRTNRSIKPETGLNRRPDAAVIKDGKVVEVGEVARTNQNGSIVSREQKKQEQYNGAQIPSTIKTLPPSNAQ